MVDPASKAAWLKAERDRRGWSAATLASAIVDAALAGGEVLNLTQQSVSHFENGKTKSVPRWVRWAEDVLNERSDGTSTNRDNAVQTYDLVPIESIDLQYGLGATFTDQHVEVEVLQFPRQWVESFTRTPSNLLTFARGRGDSMMPTIHSNDMVLIDRSQRTIAERDAIWAFTIGDIGGIKRLRPVGDRVVILSDNPSVPPDEAMAEEIRIVGRVITIIRNI